MLFRSPICLRHINLHGHYLRVPLYSIYNIHVQFFNKINTAGMAAQLVSPFLVSVLALLLGSSSTFATVNRTVAKHIKSGDFRPEHRLYIMSIGGFFIPIGFFIYGWSVHFRTHFIVPILATGIIGFGLLMTFMPASTYLVDVFTIHAASAMAASTVLRSLAAALIPLSSQTMYAKLGYGWGNSLLGFIALG